MFSGGCIAAAGLVLASFATNIYIIIVSFGFITGNFINEHEQFIKDLSKKSSHSKKKTFAIIPFFINVYMLKFDFGGINLPFNQHQTSWAVKYMANEPIVSESVIKQEDL